MNNLVFFVLGLGLPMAMAEAFYTANVTMGAEEIIFNSTDIVVNPKEMVQLDCGMKGHTEDHKACVWTKTNGIETLSYQIQDVYQGVFSSRGKPENETYNQCGIVLKSIKPEDHGVWKCAIFILGRSIIGEKTVKVTVKPEDVSSPENVTANADDNTSVNCTVGQAEPPATITWTLNGTDITSEAKEEVKANFEWSKKKVTVDDPNGVTKQEWKHEKRNTGNSSTISILSHKFTKNENNQILKCIINHTRLENPEIRSIPVTVGIAPNQMKEETFWNISKSSDHTIKFKYSAFPKPTVNEWKHGKQPIQGLFQANGNSSDGHIIASLNEIENGTYQAELKIVGLQANDYKHKYVFEVKNVIGKAFYKFNISEHEKPKGGSNSVNSAWFLYTLLSILALYL